MAEQKLSFPTEVVTLPSKGIVYLEDNPLAKGEIEMKYMRAKEEDILTNKNFIEKGIVLDKLLQSLIVSKINYDDLIAPDKDALLIAARILGYGKDYEFTYKKEKVTIDLTTLPTNELDEEIFKQGVNEFEFTLPNSKTKLTFKFLNGHDEKVIDQEIKGLKKVFGDKVSEGVVRLKKIITSIEDNREQSAINEFVDNHLLAMDARALRKYIRQIQPGIITKVFVGEDLEEEINIPIGINFFWPDFEL